MVSIGLKRQTVREKRGERNQVSRLESRRNFFSQRVPAAWNNVPSEIRQARSAQAFKKTYNAHRSLVVIT